MFYNHRIPGRKRPQGSSRPNFLGKSTVQASWPSSLSSCILKVSAIGEHCRCISVLQQSNFSTSAEGDEDHHLENIAVVCRSVCGHMLELWISKTKKQLTESRSHTCRTVALFGRQARHQVSLSQALSHFLYPRGVHLRTKPILLCTG